MKRAVFLFLISLMCSAAFAMETEEKKIPSEKKVLLETAHREMEFLILCQKSLMVSSATQRDTLKISIEESTNKLFAYIQKLAKLCEQSGKLEEISNNDLLKAPFVLPNQHVIEIKKVRDGGFFWRSFPHLDNYCWMKELLHCMHCNNNNAIYLKAYIGSLGLYIVPVIIGGLMSNIVQGIAFLITAPFRIICICSRYETKENIDPNAVISLQELVDFFESSLKQFEECTDL